MRLPSSGLRIDQARSWTDGFGPAYRLPFATCAGNAAGITDNAAFSRLVIRKLFMPLAFLARRGWLRRLAHRLHSWTRETLGNSCRAALKSRDWRPNVFKGCPRFRGSGLGLVQTVSRKSGLGRSRARSKDTPARPYICRFIIFNRLMCPSTGPLLHGSVTAASTAFKSCFKVWTKRFSA